MNQQRRLPESASRKVEADNNSFSGLWIRWGTVTQAERFISSCIVLTPLWWVMGWTHLLLLLVVGVAAYEVQCNGSLRLQRPSLTVISAIAFGLYRIVSTSIHSEVLIPSIILPQIATWVCLGLMIWYIENKDIRVRPQVVAWACSVLVVQMLLFWIVVHFVFKEPYYSPPRSLFALFTDKAERFIPGSGSSNYLLPYWPDDKLLGGLVRFAFFFPVPESFALVVGFIGLLALDIKNRLWSLLLFLASVFLLLLSGTRSMWIAFPIVIVLRYLLTTSSIWGPWFLFTIIAVVSFITFSLPPVTDFISNTYTGTSEATGNLRRNSTEARSKIYKRTLDAVLNEPDKLFLGRGVPGVTVVPGYAPAKIGSHSFILGTLLYRSGVLGTGIFLIFWTSLILRFYKMRVGRPLWCLLTILLFSLTFFTMELDLTASLVILLCMATSKPAAKLIKRVRYA